MREASQSESILSIAGFSSLTRDEAALFDRHLVALPVKAGEPIPLAGSLVILERGTASLRAAGATRLTELTDVAAGAVLGETSLFTPDPAELSAVACDDSLCRVITLRDLKRCFRYSRQATVKWLTIFARDMSTKVRQANIRLAAGPRVGLDLEQPSPIALSPLDLDRFNALTEHRSFGTGTCIFAEGDRSEELYVIESGTVLITHSTPDGDSLRLAELGPGDSFGEMSFVDQRPRSATAIAASPLRLHALPAGALDRLTEQSLPTGLYLSDVICKILAARLASVWYRLLAA